MMIFRFIATRKYRRYRKECLALYQQVVDKYVNDKVLRKAVRELHLGKNRELVIDTADDLSVLMDYAIYEVNVGGVSLVEKYKTEVGGKNRIECDILAATSEASTGIFRVGEIFEKKHCIGLSDLGDESRKILLTDINFSRTIMRDMIMFFRPLELPDFTTTSGITFVFPAEMETELRNKWQKWEGLGTAERYVKFFRLYKSSGIPTYYN